MRELAIVPGTGFGLGAALAAFAAAAVSLDEPRYIGGFNRPGPEPISDPSAGGRGRRNPHYGGKRYAGGSFKGSPAAKAGARAAAKRAKASRRARLAEKRTKIRWNGLVQRHLVKVAA